MAGCTSSTEQGRHGDGVKTDDTPGLNADAARRRCRPMTLPEDGFPGQDELESYKLYRDRIANENLLVYHRLSWLLVAQSTMFSVWAVAFSRAGGPARGGTAVLAGLG